MRLKINPHFLFLKAHINYTEIYYEDKIDISSYTLKRFEHLGLRVNRSIIVNPKFAKFEKDIVTVKDYSFKISRRRCKQFGNSH